jgi:cytokinin dehydrogenase
MMPGERTDVPAPTAPAGPRARIPDGRRAVRRLARRGFLGLMAATVVGFDASRRTWVTGAEAASGPSFSGAPALDGDLVIEAPERGRFATDLGAIVFTTPRAVLRPGSARDIAVMVGFCRRHGIPVATRGAGHTTNGQGLTGGLLVENRRLARIHDLAPDAAHVDSGLLWKDLLRASFAQRSPRTPPVLTAYTSLSVGGTLSVGGIGGLVGGIDTGLQVDHVRELEVATGTGELVRCSARTRPDLFAAVLGGLGQVGVITKAVLDLVPAKQRARTATLQYDDSAAFAADLATVVERPAVDHVYAEFLPPGGTSTYAMYVTGFYDTTPPEAAALAGGLTATPEIADTGYLEYVFAIDELIDGIRETQGWDDLVKPWYDIWLPGDALGPYLAELVPSLDPGTDLGPLGAGLIYPQRRGHVHRPRPRLPRRDGSQWAYVLDLNTVSTTPSPGPEYADRMLERNKRLYDRARSAYGASLYPIGSVPFSGADWRDHFGPTWPEFSAAKRAHDPDGILTPGPGIF